ncbi:phosphotransferase [Variovorax sp. GT1P44]|uniref:phosphotransferase n=1 Tax=Variovorax sp. GT1P44 TaxID=3443742 RepID=UPI003F4701DD
MDSSLLTRLLAIEPLMAQISRQVDLSGARLLSATARPVDAPGYLSELIGVTLAWTPGAAAPAQAVLKASHAGFGQAELPFYQTVANRLDCPAVPRFFAGGTDEPSGRTWLLMEDLSGSHERPSEAPLPPTFARCARLVEALAQFHAAGWEDTDLLSGTPTLVQRLRSIELQEAAERMFDQAGDALDNATRVLYSLQEDYRLAVLLHLRTPIARFTRKMSAYVWWPQLMRIRDAVEDHRCVDLLS